MNIISNIFSNSKNVIFRCIFWEKIIFAFLRKGSFTFVGKEIPSLRNIQKTYFHVFFEKDHLSFSVRRKNIIFLGKRNAIFPDDRRKVIFQCDFFGKTIFSEHLKNISYFHVFFWERSSFIFRLKNKIIFSGKSFLMIREKLYSSVIFLEKSTFQNIWKKELWFFVQWCLLGAQCQNQIPRKFNSKNKKAIIEIVCPKNSYV